MCLGCLKQQKQRKMNQCCFYGNMIRAFWTSCVNAHGEPTVSQQLLKMQNQTSLGIIISTNCVPAMKNHTKMLL